MDHRIQFTFPESPVQVSLPPPNGQTSGRKVCDNPDYEPERQCFGYTIAIILLVIFVFILVRCFHDIIFNPGRGYNSLILRTIGFTLLSYFYYKIIKDPKYCGGKPDTMKFWPFFVGILSTWVTELIGRLSYFHEFVGLIVILCIMILIPYVILFQDDTSESCWLCFKPWVFKKKKKLFIPTYHNPYPYQVHGQILYPYQNYGQTRTSYPYPAAQTYEQTGYHPTAQTYGPYQYQSQASYPATQTYGQAQTQGQYGSGQVQPFAAPSPPSPRLMTDQAPSVPFSNPPKYSEKQRY